jgi:hypothetical protein
VSDAFDTGTAHSARRYNYWLGGKDNFAADRASAEAIKKVMPTVVKAATANRDFMQRTVRHLITDHGVRQFLDIGTGIPASPNLHEVAQNIAPETRVVYADNDPIVLSHARALMTSAPQGATAFAAADLRRPADLLATPEVKQTLDLAKPVGLMLIAVLHFLYDDAGPADVVATLVDALPSGSWVVASHGTADLQTDPADAERFALGQGVRLRSAAEFAALFDHPRVRLLDSALPMVSRWWRAPGEEVPDDADVSVYGLVARVD